MQTGKVTDYIVDWLQRYASNAGVKGFVVGISGGVDSAVTSVLCAKTGFPVMAVTMPIRQAESQKTLAEKHVSWLKQRFDNVTGHRADLTAVLEAFEKSLPADIQDDLTMANTRARIRMGALYAYAGHYNMLVAGTGNKVEDFGVGFFTKYGDGGVDIAPIADLMKSEVYETARELGIIAEIIGTSPTDGLWPDSRSDEEQLGATYDELEWAMRFEEQSGNEKDLTERQKRVLGIFRRFNRKNRHKMEPIPVPVIPGEYKS
ncbi:MAG: NAD(+) synthase [Desulfobacteraceae bacterium]|nr:NAD(+) synthase [Desulfobacteraceae bacterium]